MNSLWHDLRYGTRMLIKHPGFTLVAALTLALGIGANSAIFSVVNAVLLRPLPYEEPQRLMLLRNAPRTVQARPSSENLLNWKDKFHAFDHIAAHQFESGGLNLTGQAEPERVAATDATANFFATLGVKAMLGRTFLPDETSPGKNQVAVLSYGLWRRRYGANPDIVGTTIALNGRSFAVVGVAPPGFDYPGKIDLWIPMAFGADRILSGGGRAKVIARLKPGVSFEQARAEAAAFSQWLKQEFPNTNLSSAQIEAIPLRSYLVGEVRQTLYILFAAVGLVLLIACANVTNLLLARATSRRKEVAIRMALGAGRWRLIRQLLAENALLALLGGGGGCLLALWGVDLLVSLGPGSLPRLQEIRLERWAFGFTLLISLLTGVLFSLAPAWQASKVDLNEALKESGAKLKVGFGSRHLRSLLVVAETALALVLLIGAGLLIKSLWRLQQVDSGFNSQNVLTVALSLPDSTYPESAQKRAFYQQLVERLKTIPGAQAVGAINFLPLGLTSPFGGLFSLEGPLKSEPFKDRFANYLVVTPDYFQAMGIPLVQGHVFTDHDTANSPPVVVINDIMARRFWPHESAIGKRLSLSGEPTPREIVGVVRAVKHFGPEGESYKEMYLPYLQNNSSLLALVIRASADPLSLVSAVRAEVQALDKNLPLYDIKTMDQRLAASLAQRRFTLLLLAGFAAVALLLAAIGIYGVMGYTVTQRTQEIGIRVALGAQTSDVLKLIIRQGMTLTVIGVGSGLLAALALTRLMKSLLFGVNATDPATFVVIALLLTGVALLACYIPARRATKVDPMVALRYE